MIPERLPLSRRVRNAFWRVPVDREIAEELAAHIELQTRRYIEAGMSEDEARRAACERFGDIDRVRTECTGIRNDMEAGMERSELRQELRMDVGFAVRALRRSPLFTIVAVATIALAVGANTAIFSVLDAVLFRSLPYRNADRASLVWNSNSRTTVNHTAVAIPEYFDLKEGVRAHDAVAAIRPQPRFDALLLGIFAVTVLVLASVGLYGAMAYLVAPRTREIGIRMALGGEPSAIRYMVLREGILISVSGLVLGGLLSLAGSRAISGLLFGVQPTDAPTYASIASLLVIVGAAASYGPARRATRVDPLDALRDAGSRITEPTDECAAVGTDPFLFSDIGSILSIRIFCDSEHNQVALGRQKRLELRPWSG